jgi:hypothetical protein
LRENKRFNAFDKCQEQYTDPQEVGQKKNEDIKIMASCFGEFSAVHFHEMKLWISLI